MTDQGEAYIFRGRHFVAKGGEVFELTDNGLAPLSADFSKPHEPVLVYRPRLWCATPLAPKPTPHPSLTTFSIA